MKSEPNSGESGQMLSQNVPAFYPTFLGLYADADRCGGSHTTITAKEIQ